MVEEHYAMTVGKMDEIEKWLTESKYSDKTYGVKLNKTFKIITGAYEEDNDVSKIIIPINYYGSTDGVTIVDLRGIIKSGISTIDSITDFVPTRSLGNHKLETGIIIHLYMTGYLESIKKDIIRIMATIITQKIASSLSLDALDVKYLMEAFTAYFVGKVYNTDTYEPADLLHIQKTIVKNENIDDDVLLGLYKGYIDLSVVFTLLKSLDISKRLQKLDDERFEDILTGLVFMQMTPYLNASILYPEYILGLVYTTMKNPLYKNSQLFYTLKKNKKWLNIDELLKVIEQIMKSNDVGV